MNDALQSAWARVQPLLDPPPTSIAEHQVLAVALNKLAIEAQHARRAIELLTVDAAMAEPHPWLGKKVKREARTYYGATSNKTQRGIVKIATAYLGLRNHRPRPGEFYVVSASGKTAWRLEDKRNPWELDE